MLDHLLDGPRQLVLDFFNRFFEGLRVERLVFLLALNINFFVVDKHFCQVYSLIVIESFLDLVEAGWVRCHPLHSRYSAYTGKTVGLFWVREYLLSFETG